MRLSRRRFLSVSAAAAVATPASAQTIWQGIALGTRAEIRLAAEPSLAGTALLAARDAIERVEQAFSLYRKNSELNQLNRSGHLRMSPIFSALVERVHLLQRETDGLFDPSVGTLWRGLLGEPTGPVGWDKVAINGQDLSLPRGMTLTFNGIAQGFATDRVAHVLRAHGFHDVVVDIGEIWVGDGARRIGLPDRTRMTLRNSALATSAVDALTVNGQSHILHPRYGNVGWAGTTVEAGDATTADALSTALTLSGGTKLAQDLLSTGLIKRAWLRGLDGSNVLL